MKKQTIFDIAIAIWIVSLSLLMYLNVIGVFPPPEMPDMRVTDSSTFRMFDSIYQETIVKIQNCGDAEATDITIKISFPDNVTIKYCKDYYNTSYNQGQLIEGGIDSYYCTYRFNSLDINYAIPIRIVSTYPDFNLTNTFTIDPLPIYMQNK